MAADGYLVTTEKKSPEEIVPEEHTEKQQTALPSQPSMMVDINTATAEELEQLKGIGSALAQRIVKDREENGAFETLDDLSRVSGIGPSKIDGLRDTAVANSETEAVP